MRSANATPPGSRSTVAPSARASPAISVVFPAPSRPSTVISIGPLTDRRWSGVLALDAHPHARAVLGAALSGMPAHAYLLHGPAGSGKREVARAFAGELLARGAKDPDNARVRAAHGAHPDLTWVVPSGAHEMLRRDVDEAVVGAAAHTPFEASHRVFVLERADTMNDEAANALLKTLEEPPSYVVLLLLTDRLTQVLPTIASRCQAVRFDPPGARGARAAPAEPGRPAGDRRGVRAPEPGRRREGARARARRRARAARRRREPRPRAAARQDRCRASVAGDPGPREAARGGRPRARRGRARRGAAVPAQEGAQAARDRVQRARPPRRPARDDGGARPRAPAHRPVVPRPGLRRRRRARARVSLRSHRGPARGRRAARPRRCARPRSSSTTRAPA